MGTWRNVVAEPEERVVMTSGALAVGPPTKDGLAKESASWSERARGLRIVDSESCKQASLLLRSIKGLRTDIATWFAPHVDAAMETKRKAEAARKALVDEKDRMEAPLVDAEAVIKRSLLTYEEAQERARQDEQRRLQAESDRRAEAINIEAAAALELQANASGDADMLQEAHDLFVQPVEAPVVSVAKTMPKVQGIVYRDQWKAHETIDVRALATAVASGAVPPTFLTPNVSALNAFARATQGAQPVPGVRFWNDRAIAARG
jgi:hypothetical protein